MQIRHIPDCTVVRLPDGRIGWKGVNTPSTKRNIIVLPGGSAGVELRPGDEVEVVFYPAQLAKAYVDTAEDGRQEQEQ